MNFGIHRTRGQIGASSTPGAAVAATRAADASSGIDGRGVAILGLVQKDGRHEIHYQAWEVAETASPGN